MEAEQLKNDPRIAQGKKLLLEAISDHQQRIQGVKPPDPALKLSYEEAIKQFAKFRGGSLWHPYIGSGLGNGPLVELLDGSVKYDCINGIGVHVLGHSHLGVIEACLDGAINNTVMQGHLQQNLESLKLMEQLCKFSGMDHCFLTSSGVMANENALKIAFQKRTPAARILAFEHCFAGRTWAFSQITDKPSFRQGLPLNVQVDYLPFYDSEAPEESTRKALARAQEHLARYPNQHGMAIFELVQGEGGINVGSRPFFEKLMRLFREKEIPIIADEVQTFGRTQELFAFRYFGLEPFVDIVTIGKLSQTCATLFNDSFLPKVGLLSQTFTSSSSMIYASLAILKELTEGNYFGREGKNAQLEKQFKEGIQKLQKKYPEKISGVYGIGTMLAFTPYEGDLNKVTDYAHRLFDAGLITFITGQAPTRIRLLLSVAITEKDLENILNIIEKEL